MRWMYDASEPPAEPPHWHVAGGYIGGNTPHVWTRDEWKAQPAPYLLPIWTASDREDTAAAAGQDAWDIITALNMLGVPRGVTIAVDTETTVYSRYIPALSDFLLGQVRLMNYGSFSFVTRNPLTSGGRWAADWTGQVQTGLELDHTHGIVAVQIADDKMLSKPWDWSLIDAGIPLWARP